MPLLRRKKVLAAKIETTIGTAESLSASDGAMNVYDASIQPEIAMVDREGEGGFNYLASVPEGYKGTATFKTYIEWDGTSTEPAWADTFLPACGWVKSTNTYYPKTAAPGSDVKTLTIGVYEDGRLMSLAGAAGTFKIVLPTGKPAYFEWTFSGVWQTVADTAIITPTYPTDTPLRYAGGFATWNSINLCVESCTIDAGNEVVMRECPTTSAGYISAIITNRMPKVTANPEATLVATQDRWAAWLAMTQHALSMQLDGPSTSTLTFNAPKAQVVKNATGDRSNMITEEVEWLCCKNAGTHDQELSIVFTP